MRFKPHQAEGEKILKVFQNLFPGAAMCCNQLCDSFPKLACCRSKSGTFDDVDRVVVGHVLDVIVIFRVLFVRIVHVAAAGYTADAVFKGPVLLGHQPHFASPPNSSR